MTLEEMLEVLVSSPGSPVAYGRKAIPHPYDEEISRFIASFCALVENDKKVISDCLDRKSRGILMTFAVRMASLALTNNSSQLLFEAIVALGIGVDFDDTESTVYQGPIALTLLYHSAALLQVDLSTVVRQATPCIDRQATTYIENFLQKPVELSQMRYIQINDTKGFRYKQDW